jgi:hypothetical protein
MQNNSTPYYGTISYSIFDSKERMTYLFWSSTKTISFIDAYDNWY